uniref:Cadherin-23 n=1 Tax=Schistosoma haematobium TaxID=6185 RepID=A0A095AXF1_SCHHA
MTIIIIIKEDIIYYFKKSSLNPLCTELNVTVTVLDENDNKPEWHYPHARDKEVNITSDLPPGRIVARILAMDLDAGENGRVVYSLIDPHRRTVFQVRFNLFIDHIYE